jgi:hypothetical protein
MKTFFTVFIIIYGFLTSYSQGTQGIDQTYWKINERGNIVWEVDASDYGHRDHVEMSGKQVSVVLRYGINQDGSFEFSRGMVWPLLRTIPNNTHASLMRRMHWDVMKDVQINGVPFITEKVRTIELAGSLSVHSELSGKYGAELNLTREFFPGRDQPAFYEIYSLKNSGDAKVRVMIPYLTTRVQTDSEKGLDGSYEIVCKTEKVEEKTLEPGERIAFTAYTAAYNQTEQRKEVDIDEELAKREDLVFQIRSKLVFESPDPTLNTLFDYAKLRASESIYETSGGPMHGPGGESYYAAIWANDQAEYINPFFPFLGYEYGNESALNSFRHFARFMNDEFKPIPSSIIAEGTDIWNGAGDRGDAAMIAYGSARYSLARGNPEELKELWPLIQWCLAYCKRQMNEHGVVASDTDELENRFESGDANLCTSSIYYDALISASYIASVLSEPSLADRYKEEADQMRKNIEAFFGAKVEGFETYRYYEGNTILRSWICIPLTVGILDRKEATIDALFSDRLWTNDGLLTEAGSETYWDRSTLYALRGVIAAGEIEKGIDYLHYYSTKRLLGEHVPYPVEAYPEGNQRHLSAESGLYCRIMTEGLFGIRPTGLNSFSIKPQLPSGWDFMRLKNIQAFGGDFDIEVLRKSGRVILSVLNKGKNVLTKEIQTGQVIDIIL